MRRGMALLSRLSMVAGLVLTVAGLSIRGGMLGMLAGGGPSASAVPAPSAVAVVASPTVAPVTVAPVTVASPGADPATAPPPPIVVDPSPAPVTAPPADPTALVFEDTFAFEGAWPTGQLGDLDAAYGDGLFILAGPGSELPTFIAPVAQPLAPAATVVVEAALTLEPYAEAGVYLGTTAYERIGAVVSADGRVVIFRESIESLDVIGTGSVVVTGPLRLTLALDGATVSAAVDGRQVVAVALPATALDFGLVTWPTDMSVARIAEFRVVASAS